MDPEFGEPLPPLQDDLVRFNGQPIAVVVADTLEQARRAAALVKVTYREEKPVTDFAGGQAHSAPSQAKNDQGKQRPPDYERGDPDKALDAAEVRVSPTYTIPTEHHNPIETHATLAEWDGDKLTLHDKTQWVYNVRTQVALAFDLAAGRRPRDLAVRRRGVRLGAAYLVARPARGDGGEGRQAPRQARPDPAADVHRAGLPAAHRAEGLARRDPGRQADRDPPRGHGPDVDVRAVHRERAQRAAYALRLPQRRDRLPPRRR